LYGVGTPLLGQSCDRAVQWSVPSARQMQARGDADVESAVKQMMLVLVQAAPRNEIEPAGAPGGIVDVE
jgi:hypothetical protein